MECPLWLVHFPLPSFTPDSCIFLAQHRPGITRKPSVASALQCWDQTKGLAHIRQVLDPRATAQVLGWAHSQPCFSVITFVSSLPQLSAGAVEVDCPFVRLCPLSPWAPLSTQSPDSRYASIVSSLVEISFLVVLVMGCRVLHTSDKRSVAKLDPSIALLDYIGHLVIERCTSRWKEI